MVARSVHASVTRESPVKHACVTENQLVNSCLNFPSGEGEKEGKGKEGEEEGKGDSLVQSIDAHASPSSPVIYIPINSGEHPILQNQIFEWEKLYPGVDVLQALRNIRGWNLANPKRRKTKSGILSHINTWLAKEQNHASKQTLPSNNRAPPNSLNEHNAYVAEQWLRESESKIVEGEIIK